MTRISRITIIRIRKQTMPEKSVVLEHYEIISPLGNLSETVADCIDGISAIRPGPCFDVPVSWAPFKDQQCRDLRHAAALLKPSLDVSELDPAVTLFLYCCAKGDIGALESHAAHGEENGAISPLPGGQAEFVKNMIFPDAARTMAVSNACASGAIAVETAKELLQAGDFTHAIIFGFDAISRFVTTGFHSLSALSPTASRPFDAGRDGLTIGEAACIALLSRRAPFDGDIVVEGAGSSNDANHRTGPSRTGDGLMRAARAAMIDAQWRDGEPIGAIKCHGTATAYNDAMEAKALEGLFGPIIPPCCSLKGAIGHGSGAGSLLETLVAAQCLERHILPPTVGFQSLGVEEKIPVSAEPQLFKQNTLLCLSAGFGGINAALLLREHAA